MRQYLHVLCLVGQLYHMLKSHYLKQALTEKLCGRKEDHWFTRPTQTCLVLHFNYNIHLLEFKGGKKQKSAKIANQKGTKNLNRSILFLTCKQNDTLNSMLMLIKLVLHFCKRRNPNNLVSFDLMLVVRWTGCISLALQVRQFFRILCVNVAFATLRRILLTATVARNKISSEERWKSGLKKLPKLQITLDIDLLLGCFCIGISIPGIQVLIPNH